MIGCKLWRHSLGQISEGFLLLAQNIYLSRSLRSGVIVELISNVPSKCNNNQKNILSGSYNYRYLNRFFGRYKSREDVQYINWA